MSLSHSGYAYFTGTAKHGLVAERDTEGLPLAIAQFFGVRGESYIVGEQYGSLLDCELILDGYATNAAIGNAIVELKTKRGLLTGTLTESIGGNTRSWPNTVFLGFAEASPLFVDGKDGTYVQFLRLFWRHANTGASS